jgi:P4 family phage/plasmid primase-like protien
MTDPTQFELSQNDRQPKPLQNGFNPDVPHSGVHQSGPPPSELKEQLPQTRTIRPIEGDPAELVVERMLDRHFAGGKHLMLSSDARFWHYNGRVWRPVADQWISGKALGTIRANPLKGQKAAPLLGQVLTLLKANLTANDDLLDFNVTPLPVINCINGELWLTADGGIELRPHQPRSFLRHCLGVAYDPAARCPEYDRALRGIFGGAKKPEALIRHWHELVGYIIQQRRHLPIIPILFGRGDNGKTKLMHTVMQLLGPGLVHAQRIEDLDKSRFAMGSLFGKFLFVDDDVRAGARLPDGILKTVSEAKEVTGELKFGPTFNFVVRAVPVLLCNNIPSLADLSHGMLRRLMVIPFDRIFTDMDKDPELFDRIVANELAGVLNRALEGYRRLLVRGTFKLPTAVKNATARWLRHANPLPAFIEACCDKQPEAECRLADFYAAYAEWGRQMGYTLTQSQQTVSFDLQHLGFAATTTSRGRVFVGLKLLDRDQE